MNKLEKINVAKFDDLVNLAEQNKTNIIYYQIEKDRKSDFYVVIDKYVYIYEIEMS